MTRFKVDAQKHDETSGQCACVFFVETVTHDETAARAVAHAVHWSPGAESDVPRDTTAWVYLGRDWLAPGAGGIDPEFRERVRAWLVDHAGMADDDQVLLSTWTAGFAKVG